MGDVSVWFTYAAAAVIATVFALLMVRAGWRAASVYKLRNAPPRPLFGVEHVLWEVRPTRTLDLAAGPGGREGAPLAPFEFLAEHDNGSQPCVSVRDARGRRWRVKWGQEVQAETFAVRLAWACGYFAEVTYFVGDGVIAGAPALRRAAGCVSQDGRFAAARFELDDPEDLKLFEEHSWSWTDNPFVGTHELAGLKILLMLVSNWDNKDQRDVARGSNTAIYVRRLPDGRRQAVYMIADWGGSMGRWGGTLITRGRWDPDGFAAQTPQFVTSVDDGLVRFGYAGQRTGDLADGIRVEDAAWLCRSIGVLTDDQICAALTASGAAPDETASFAISIRDRIEQLRRAAAPGSMSPRTSGGIDRSEGVGVQDVRK